MNPFARRKRAPAPVASLPTRTLVPSVTFSTPESVTFSTPNDSDVARHTPQILQQETQMFFRGFARCQLFLVLALASLGWTPSLLRGQEVHETACTELEVPVGPDSTLGVSRMRTRIALPGTGWLGFSTVWGSGSLPKPGGYPRVGQVFCGYPADEAGLQPGDLVLAVNGRDGRQPRAISAGRPGTVVEFRIQPGQEVLEMTMVSVRDPRDPPREHDSGAPS